MEKTAKMTPSRAQVRDAEGNFLIRTEWLKNYVILNEPGTYRVQVTSEPNLYDPAMDGMEGSKRYIVNFKAIEASNIPTIKQLFAGNEFVKADDTKGLFLNGTIWVNEDENGNDIIPTVPHKGQFVEVNVDYVELRDGSQGLRVTDVFAAPVKNGVKFDLDAILGAEDANIMSEMTDENGEISLG